MYGLTKPVAATEFTRLPERFRKPGRTSWGDANAVGQMLDSFLEGPSFDRDGNLYVTDIPFGRVFRIDPKGEWTLVTEYDGWPNGLKIHKDGRIFITDYKRGIVLLDPATGKVTPLIETRGSESFKGVNDLFFAANGDMWFTDQGLTGWQDPSGRLFRVRADGAIDCVLDCIPSPNGLVMNLDETIMYVAVTRANAIWKFLTDFPDPLKPMVGLYIQLSGSLGPDGMAMRADGLLATAHAQGGRAILFDRMGDPVAVVTTPGGTWTTSVAFSADGRRLFIVDAQTSTVYAAPLEGLSA